MPVMAVNNESNRLMAIFLDRRLRSGKGSFSPNTFVASPSLSTFLLLIRGSARLTMSVSSLSDEYIEK